jgi:hypothetical protein
MSSSAPQKGSREGTGDRTPNRIEITGRTFVKAAVAAISPRLPPA